MMVKFAFNMDKLSYTKDYVFLRRYESIGRDARNSRRRYRWANRSPEARNKTRIRKRDYKRKIKKADDDQQVKKVAKLIRTGKKFFKQACVQTSR